MTAKRGFTLIEMLTVIVIIAILAATTMKLMVLVNQKTAKSRAAGDLERIKQALTEYYASYGCFPPVSGMVWEYAGPAGPAAIPDGGMGYRDGLATYLFNDTQKDRWSKYLVGLQSPGSHGCVGDSAGYGRVTWTNSTLTIADPWGKDYQYSTVDPYQAYKLFSLGPDGSANTGDDVGSKWAE